MTLTFDLLTPKVRARRAAVSVEYFGQKIVAIRSIVQEWMGLSRVLSNHYAFCFKLLKQSPDGVTETDNKGVCSNLVVYRLISN